MRQVFNEIDEDGSGELDYDEFLSAFKKINPDASIDHLQATFEEADIDGSGTLDFNEVSDFFWIHLSCEVVLTHTISRFMFCTGTVISFLVQNHSADAKHRGVSQAWS